MENIINQLSAVSAIATFIVLIAYKSWKNIKVNLSDGVMVAIAGGMLPLAVGFTLYPFFPSFIGSIEKMSLQITLTGLVLIFVYSKTIIQQMRVDSS